MTGGWPTIDEYIDWARSKDCTVELGEVTRSGVTYLTVTIEASSGKHVVEVVVERSDLLMSTTVARLDRRLGLKSSLFS